MATAFSLENIHVSIKCCLFDIIGATASDMTAAGCHGNYRHGILRVMPQIGEIFKNR